VTMAHYAALLRGVNVGGNAIVKMKDLKSALEDAGLRNVRTYINSGNLVFESTKKDVRALEKLAAEAIRERCGVACAVVVKSASEYEAIVRALPESWADDDEWRCNVIFLRHTVDSEKVLDELGAKTGIEEMVYCPGAVLWRVRRSDYDRSNGARVNRKPIYQEITVRNLNTTRKLYAMLREARS
jgi:uncharacterized protein (DUF1697 family)